MAEQTPDFLSSNCQTPQNSGQNTTAAAPATPTKAKARTETPYKFPTPARRGVREAARSPDVGVEDVADFEVDGPVGPHQQVARGLLHPRRRARPRRGRRPHHGPRRVHRQPPPTAGGKG